MDPRVTGGKPEKFGDKFVHLLRYDVESVFWCMIWWSLLAQPIDRTKSDSDNDLDPTTWINLTAEEDQRYLNFIASNDHLPVHPKYAPIHALLDEMRIHLRVDLQHSKDKTRRDNPEYLCEVFQRLILNFLVDREDEQFLDLPKDEKNRNHGDLRKAPGATSTRIKGSKRT